MRSLRLTTLVRPFIFFVKIVLDRLVQDFVASRRRVVAGEVPVAEFVVRGSWFVVRGWAVRWLQALAKVVDGLVDDLDFRLHAGRREETRDFRAVLLFGEAGIEFGERVFFDRIYRINRIGIGGLGGVSR